jgi:hypothetical protein
MNATVRNCAYQVAVVYAGLGDHELTVDWLETAWRTHQALFPFLRVDPRFRELSGNLRFRQVLRRADIAAAM